MSTPKGIHKMFENIQNDLAKQPSEDIQAIVIYSTADNIISIAHTEDEARCNELLEMATQALSSRTIRSPNTPLQ